MRNSEDQQALFAEYASGGISRKRLQLLEAALREDFELRNEFVEYMNLDAALGDLAALTEDEIAEIESETKTTGNTVVGLCEPGVFSSQLPLQKPVTVSQSARYVATLFVAVAASLSLALGIWKFGSRQDDNPATARANQPAVRLVTEVDAVLKRGTATWNLDTLPVGEFNLERGLLHLEFYGGVTVFVEAPAQFDVGSTRRVVLHSGRLSANVPPEGIGFTVVTPEAEVIDFGTEFSVEVESGSSEVHVFEGLVRVQPRSQKDGESGEAVDVRTSQAVKIEDATDRPVDIELAEDRFIRNFEEPTRNYSRSVMQLLPVSYYRMPIRDRGLISKPLQYSGEVLTGDGIRPPHARGVFAGGSLRVGARSTGRGGRVDSPPPLSTGQFSLAVFVYLETGARAGTVAANIRGDDGNFALSLDENGLIQATTRNSDRELQSIASDSVLPLTTWRHFVMTADGNQLRLYEDGQLVASTQCALLTTSDSETVWFGTAADGSELWNGRIDELALFDRALSDRDIADLYQAALEEMARSE